MSNTNGWTEERRAKQAEAIREWKPWEKSTGPKTEEGKAISSRNADRGGLRELDRAFKRQRAVDRKMLAKLMERDNRHMFTGEPIKKRVRKRGSAAQERLDAEIASLAAQSEYLSGEVERCSRAALLAPKVNG